MTTQMSTERIYYQDTYLCELNAVILTVSSDEQGDFVVFNQTNFHPQGGGQPSDEGFFEIEGQQIPVIQLAIDGEIIKHYFKSIQGLLLKVGSTARLHIDRQKRILYARLHSAGHLIANVVKELYPQLSGCKGNHFPGGQASVFCQLEEGATLPDLNVLKIAVTDQICDLIQKPLRLHNFFESKPRLVQFENYPAYPCGGTHVEQTTQIGKIMIRNVKKEKDFGCKIGYDIQ